MFPLVRSLSKPVTRRIAPWLEAAIPPGLQPVGHYWANRLTGHLRPDFAAAMALARPGTIAIDAGANIGIYSYGFSRAGAQVHAFDPQPKCASVIRALGNWQRRLPNSGLPITLHEAALGASDGVSQLHVPIRGGKQDAESASFLTPRGEYETHTVPIHPLDSFEFRDVSVIKIDVEGFELDVLEGAIRTIQHSRPAMFIEIEQRHHSAAICSVFDMVFKMLGRSYRGWYIDMRGAERPLELFDVQRDQLDHAASPTSPAYINNFFFTPRS